MSFELHSRLAADCEPIGDFELCRALLLNDSRYPWVVLVPRVNGISEPFQLSDSHQILLMKESNAVLQLMSRFTQADKMNVAALGNVVPQLHVHHVARFEGDFAWPGPVWGQGVATPYPADALSREIKALRVLFAALLRD